MEEPNPAAPHPELLSRRTVAALLGRSPSFVDLLRRQGHLQAVRFPGRRNCAGYRRVDIERLISSTLSS